MGDSSAPRVLFNRIVKAVRLHRKCSNAMGKPSQHAASAVQSLPAAHGGSSRRSRSNSNDPAGTVERGAFSAPMLGDSQYAGLTVPVPCQHAGESDKQM